MLPYKRKVKSEYFIRFSYLIRPWLRTLVDQYKSRGHYPIGPWDLPKYYTATEDIEVAGYLMLVLNWSSDKLSQEINAIRVLMADKPYEWFKNRLFACLGSPIERRKKLAGNGTPHYGLIADTMDAIWRVRRLGEDDVFETITNIQRWKINAVKMLFAMPDGVGLNIIKTEPPLPACSPICNERKFLELWMPDINDDHWIDFNGAVRLLGLERDSDLIYALWGWNEIASRNPLLCRRYTSLYKARYDNYKDFIDKDSKILRDTLPNIDIY